MTVFNSTPLERRLAVLLGIPLNGVDPQLALPRHQVGKPEDLPRGRRAAARRRARTFAPSSDVVDALVELRMRRPEIRRAVVKFNDSFSGEGNAIFRYPPGQDRGGARTGAVSRLRLCAPDRDRGGVSRRARADGRNRRGVSRVRRVRVAERAASHRPARRGRPALDARPDPRRPVRPGLPGLPLPGGGTVPPQGAGRRAAGRPSPRAPGSREPLRRRLLRRRAAPGSEEWEIYALEINLRIGGTTHPFLALQFLTGGKLDPESGSFHSPGGLAKHYRSTDNLQSDAYRGPLPGGPDRHHDDQPPPLQPRHRDRRPVPHDRRALAVRKARPDRDRQQPRSRRTRIYADALAVLDRETRYGFTPSACEAPIARTSG